MVYVCLDDYSFCGFWRLRHEWNPLRNLRWKKSDTAFLPHSLHRLQSFMFAKLKDGVLDRVSYLPYYITNTPGGSKCQVQKKSKNRGALRRNESLFGCVADLYPKHGFRHNGWHRVPDSDKEVQTSSLQRTTQKRVDRFVFGWMLEFLCFDLPDYFQFLRFFALGTLRTIRQHFFRLHRRQSCDLGSLYGFGVLWHSFWKHICWRLIPTQPGNALKAFVAKAYAD